ncbi:hypothetical protein AM1_C0309 (plasmid) [Acaryochloris marina MBIC11017]|uniref:Uncharacterized protein n=1 Tax=Acaryochloris marina (strain MBIC 11017) TaxID=329726 RepID=A8ZN38_ACAM1|nr:hypothetical protein AM1_C0309 [Acaryochloris marina MBIC11017]
MITSHRLYDQHIEQCRDCGSYKPVMTIEILMIVVMFNC